MLDQIIQFSLNNPMLVSAFVLLLALVIFNETRGGAAGVSVAQTVQLLNQEEGVVIDIRNSASFNQGHITGSINLPLSEIDRRLTELEKFKEKTLILVCNTGTSTSLALSKLSKAGFEKAVKLKGGITQWQTDSMPLVKAKVKTKAKKAKNKTKKNKIATA